MASLNLRLKWFLACQHALNGPKRISPRSPGAKDQPGLRDRAKALRQYFPNLRSRRILIIGRVLSSSQVPYLHQWEWRATREGLWIDALRFSSLGLTAGCDGLGTAAAAWATAYEMLFSAAWRMHLATCNWW
jgi:hypothetical protein